MGIQCWRISRPMGASFSTRQSISLSSRVIMVGRWLKKGSRTFDHILRSLSIIAQARRKFSSGHQFPFLSLG
jgi:DNA polymerase III psi subunit